MTPVGIVALVAVDADGEWYVEGSSDYGGPDALLKDFQAAVAEMGMVPPVRISWITGEVPRPLSVDPAPIACTDVAPAEFTDQDALDLERHLQLVAGQPDVRFRDVQTANLVRRLLENYRARVAADRGAGA